jgi:hypothetical protein
LKAEGSVQKDQYEAMKDEYGRKIPPAESEIKAIKNRKYLKGIWITSVHVIRSARSLWKNSGAWTQRYGAESNK